MVRTHGERSKEVFFEKLKVEKVEVERRIRREAESVKEEKRK